MNSDIDTRKVGGQGDRNLHDVTMSSARSENSQ